MNDVNASRSRKTCEAGKPAKRRRWWFKLAAVMLSLLVVFAIGEVAVRLLYGAPLVEHEPLLMIQANRHTGWMMLPDTPHHTYHHRVEVNALGLRGKPVAPKREGEVRILALGDSMVYGQGVGDDETVPFYMEQSLSRAPASTTPGSTAASSAAAARSFTVINGGVRGFSTNQELGLLTELGQVIQPDVVVLFYYSNDVVEHDIENTFANLSRSGPLVFETKNKLEGWDRVTWDLRQFVRRSALIMWMYDRLRGSDERLIESEIALGMKRLTGYIAQMKAMSEAKGLDFVVAIVPNPNQLRGPHQSKLVDDRAAAVCDAAGVPVIRLIDAAKRADDGGRLLPVVPYDGHYNAEANRAMAEKVAEEVMRRMKEKEPRAQW